MSNNGIIVIHDILNINYIGIRTFWNIIKKHYKTKEIIASSSKAGYGIIFQNKKDNDNPSKN